MRRRPKAMDGQPQETKILRYVEWSHLLIRPKSMSSLLREIMQGGAYSGVQKGTIEERVRPTLTQTGEARRRLA